MEESTRREKLKIARIHAWGQIDDIKIEEVTRPQPQENEVLIEVHAAGVNPIDYKVCEGYFSSWMNNCFPFALGWDVSGKVVALGKGVSQFKEGDEVFGMLRFPQPAGTFSEYVTAPIDQVILKPRSCDHIYAAAMPLVSLTAWQALFETAHLQPNQTILIHAASGGVGQFAIQLAKWKKAKVIAVGSASTKTLLEGLGSDQFIDYKADKFEDKIKEKVDVVLDPLADETSLRSLKVLKPGGKLVKLLSDYYDEAVEKAKANHIEVTRMIVKPEGKALAEMAHLIDDGLLKVKVEKIYPFLQIKEALKKVKEGHAHGKIVLQVKE